VIAYQVYGSLDREDDIVARNNVSHPGFCRGGEPLSLVAPNA
jgi:prophage DNA circulation protein